MHMRSSSVDSAYRHLIASGFHVCHALVEMSYEGHVKRYSCRAGPRRSLHCGDRTGPRSKRAPYHGQRSVPHSPGRNLSRLTARKGSHDVQCTLETSC